MPNSGRKRRSAILNFSFSSFIQTCRNKKKTAKITLHILLQLYFINWKDWKYFTFYSQRYPVVPFYPIIYSGPSRLIYFSYSLSKWKYCKYFTFFSQRNPVVPFYSIIYSGLYRWLESWRDLIISPRYFVYNPYDKLWEKKHVFFSLQVNFQCRH